MTTVADLIEQLKGGLISKEELFERMATSSVSASSHSLDKSFTRESRLYIDTESEYVDYKSSCISNRGLDSPMYLDELEPREPPIMASAENSRSRSFSTKPNDEFYQRQMNYSFKKALKEEHLRKETCFEESRECTFQPQINDNTRNFDNNDIFLRLSKSKDYIMLEKQKEEIDLHNEMKELAQCTFQPEINSRSKLVKSKYMLPSTPGIRPRTQLMFQNPCTFTPAVIGPKKGMKIAHQYLSIDPFERLSQWKEEPISEDKPKEVSLCSQSTRSVHSEGGSFSDRPFFERQALYEIMKQEKKEKNSQASPHQPKICDRSRKLVKKEFSQRNTEVLQKIEEKRKSVAPPNECTFKPKITQIAKGMRNRSVNEMCYGDSEKRQQKVEEIKQLNEQQRQQGADYSSTAWLYSDIRSRLGLNSHLDTFLDRVKAIQFRKAQEALREKEEREKQELEECTHAPCIKDAPAFVKRIAQNMAIMKAERVQTPKVVKPDWR